jgi:two-component system, NtrC family, sensor histidine kinase HydH
LAVMNGGTRGTGLVTGAFLALFLGLAALAFFLVTGESRRARILVEYEADRTASGILDAFRAGRTVDPEELDARVRGFAVYRQGGKALVRFGETPDSLELPRQGFRFDARAGTLTLVRALGVPGLRSMMRPRGKMGMMGGRGGPEGQGDGLASAGGPGGAALCLVMDARPYFRARSAYAAAALFAPVLVAGLGGVFLFLLASNVRWRREAAERETLARLGESARTLAHEIRNPLAAIRIQTGLLRKGLPAGAKRELDVIDEETERLNVLSRRVGDFLKSPEGVPERVELSGFMRGLAARSPWPVTLAPEVPRAAVRFDPELLRSVLENLVRNGVESYDDEQGPVEIAVARDGGKIAVAVRDRGRGIPPGLAEKAFDPFYTSKIHGSGVGLSLSRRFVEAAGGTLTLAPRDGGGTEARIVLAEERPE